MISLCFDVENILVRKVNILDDEELGILKKAALGQLHDYILVP
jgi:hypothetical protein